jgi:GNAT superfamily N-acetyltransferase
MRRQSGVRRAPRAVGQHFTVRAVEDSDFPAAAALCAESAAHHASIQPRFFRAAGGRLPPRGKNRALLVAVDDSGVVSGLVALVVHDTPDDPLLRPLRRAHVDELVVTRAARRRGCGRALLDAARAWAVEQGADQLVLTVWEGNEAAERFYTAAGLRQVSRVLVDDLDSSGKPS